MKALAKWSRQNWLVWAVLLAYAILAVNEPASAAKAGAVGLDTFISLIATLTSVFVFLGLFQVWIDDEFVIRHLGEGSGLKGLLIGSAIGTLMHGPLVGTFPLMETLLKKGAKTGVVVAIASTWAIKLPMIPLEISLFGWRFALLRNGLLFASAFAMAPLMDMALGDGWSERFRVATGDPSA